MCGSLPLFGQRFGICIQLYALCFEVMLRQLVFAVSQPTLSLQEQDIQYIPHAMPSHKRWMPYAIIMISLPLTVANGAWHLAHALSIASLQQK